jgi:hypothetical protein
MFDPIDELIAYRKQQGDVSPTLRLVHQFHKSNPQVLDFLITELRVVRENGWTRASLGSLWHYCRWTLMRKSRMPGESFVMSNNFFPWYERIIVILHPELNGFFEMAKSKADEDFGTALEPMPKDAKPGYVRRLMWADGTPIELGWRPTVQHEPKPVSRRDRVVRVA